MVYRWVDVYWKESLENYFLNEEHEEEAINNLLNAFDEIDLYLEKKGKQKWVVTGILKKLGLFLGRT